MDPNQNVGQNRRERIQQKCIVVSRISSPTPLKRPDLSKDKRPYRFANGHPDPFTHFVVKIQKNCILCLMVAKYGFHKLNFQGGSITLQHLLCSQLGKCFNNGAHILVTLHHFLIIKPILECTSNT